MITNFADVDLTKYFEDIDFDNLKNSDNKVNNYNNHIKKNKSEICTSCGSSKIVSDMIYGIVVCTDCGQVLDDVLDCNPEWKHYEDDGKNNSRCGAPTNKLLSQSSLGTSIAGTGANRLKMIQNWNAMPYRERSLNYVYKKIQDICSKYNILKCVETDAQIMYKTVSECKHDTGKNKSKYVITRGVNRVSIIAACVFFACKRKGVTRTPKEIAEMFEISCMEMNRGCKNFLKMMKLKKFELNIGTCSSEHFVKRYCNQLHIKTQYTDDAIKLAQNIEKLNVASSHTPYSIAAACILLMCNINKLFSITKKKLSQQFNVSEVTIAKTYKKIEPYRDIITDSKATEKIWTNVDSQKNTLVISSEMEERMKKFNITLDGETTKESFSKNKVNDTNIIDDIFDIIDDDEMCDEDDDIFDDLDYGDVYDEVKESLSKIQISDDFSELDYIHTLLVESNSKHIEENNQKIKQLFI